MRCRFLLSSSRYGRHAKVSLVLIRAQVPSSVLEAIDDQKRLITLRGNLIVDRSKSGTHSTVRYSHGLITMPTEK
ncbi:hypothetical protein L596_019021 [Steinernema carpocapsae]|uniref:Uncharacterized protein n=1 Tax=Steinernema carpocapsae TaxID=34508 RepID=A0A4U5N6L0_STECR|nr:hypothetical protein L596_019021 [Steinernema carpocapsae]